MYHYLSKDEKKTTRNKYVKTKKGQEMTTRLNRIFLEGIFCLGSFIVILVSFFICKLDWWYLFFAGLTLLSGIIFIVGQHLVRMTEYNNFLKATKKK